MSFHLPRASRCLLRLTAALVAASISVITAAHASYKDDRVVLRNGDYLTGEVKKVERGKLDFKTDATDTIDIEWDDVVELSTRHHVEVETTTGERYFGEVRPGSGRGRARLEGFDTFVELDLAEIVRLTPIEDRFWARVDGSLSVGYTYTQSSGVSTFNFSSDATYRTRKYLYGIALDSNVTRQETGESSRQDLEMRFQRFLPHRWFTEWSPQLQKNEDLGIDLRVLLPVGVGRNIVQTNRVLFSLAGGLAYNEEFLAHADESTVSLEAVGGMRLEAFRYDFPRADIVTSLNVYPSLTQSGRVRASFDTSLRYELLKDFFLQLDINDNYDSKPETAEASKNDIVVSTSFGWSF